MSYKVDGVSVIHWLDWLALGLGSGAVIVDRLVLRLRDVIDSRITALSMLPMLSYVNLKISIWFLVSSSDL